jgi:hypothetical protein
MMQKYGFSMTDKGTTAVPSDVGGFYLASEVDARIAEDNATQLRLCEEAQIAAGTIAQQGQRITDLERALRKCHAVLSGSAMSKAELIDALQSIKNCELMGR